MTDPQSFEEYSAENPEPMVEEVKLINARAKASQYKRALTKKEKELEAATSQLEDLLKIDAKQVEAPKWSRPKKSKKNQATAVLMLSDMHFDEVVNPAELVGPSGRPLNKYGRDIAEQRLRRTVEGFLRVCEDLLSGFTWDGAVVLWGGDSVSGNIHEELKVHNEADPIETVDYFIDPCVALLEMLQESELFSKILNVCVVGNHGRTTRKPIAKGRVTSNFDWLLNRQIYRALKHDSTFQWNIPETADAYFDLYGYKHVLTHGDQARGGSGIAGLATPIALLDHRKRKRDAAAVSLEQALYEEYEMPSIYSHMWLGHWHTYMPMASVTVNGSLKGTDEYSFDSNFGHEEPVQAMAVVTPEHNVSLQAPIYSLDRDAEGWSDADLPSLGLVA